MTPESYPTMYVVNPQHRFPPLLEQLRPLLRNRKITPATWATATVPADIYRNQEIRFRFSPIPLVLVGIIGLLAATISVCNLICYWQTMVNFSLIVPLSIAAGISLGAGATAWSVFHLLFRPALVFDLEGVRLLDGLGQLKLFIPYSNIAGFMHGRSSGYRYLQIELKDVTSADTFLGRERVVDNMVILPLTFSEFSRYSARDTAIIEALRQRLQRFHQVGG